MSSSRHALVAISLVGLVSLTTEHAWAASRLKHTFGARSRPAVTHPLRKADSTPAFPTTVFTNSFDQQTIGAVSTGTDANSFSGTKGPANLTVENTYTNSPANALSVNVVAGGSGYVYKTFGTYYPAIEVAFSMAIGQDFTVGPGGYVAIASTETYTSTTRAGLFELTVNPGGQLGVTYYDATATQQYVWTNVDLKPNNGYDVVMQQTFGAAGALAVYVNGVEIVSVPNVNFANVPGALLWNIGNVWAAPSTAAISGHLFFDDISTSVGTLPQTMRRA